MISDHYNFPATSAARILNDIIVLWKPDTVHPSTWQNQVSANKPQFLKTLLERFHCSENVWFLENVKRC